MQNLAEFIRFQVKMVLILGEVKLPPILGEIATDFMKSARFQVKLPWMSCEFATHFMKYPGFQVKSARFQVNWTDFT